MRNRFEDGARLGGVGIDLYSPDMQREKRCYYKIIALLNSNEYLLIKNIAFQEDETKKQTSSKSKDPLDKQVSGCNGFDFGKKQASFFSAEERMIHCY